MRTLVAAHRVRLALLIAGALAARLLAPSGFMPATVHGTFEIAICSGVMTDAPVRMAGPMPGSHHDDRGGHGKPEMPCPFAGLGLTAVDVLGPALLAAAVAFAFLLAARAATGPTLAPPARLRPPLRAPPTS